jgi:hypothetical protein
MRNAKLNQPALKLPTNQLPAKKPPLTKSQFVIFLICAILGFGLPFAMFTLGALSVAVNTRDALPLFPRILDAWEHLATSVFGITILASVIFGAVSLITIIRKTSSTVKLAIIIAALSITTAINAYALFTETALSTPRGSSSCVRMPGSDVCMPITAKPVIYLYPERDTIVDVELDFDGHIFASYPAYLNGGWRNVTARPDGTLFLSGREYSYLFWDGYPSQERLYNMNEGFVVRGEDTVEFLQEKLAQIGLISREYNEFIVYWLPLMQNNNYNFIRFATPDEYDKFAKLTISPAPDSILRVFMIFKPLDNPIEVTPQTFSPFIRKGFTVVEWGGSELP